MHRLIAQPISIAPAPVPPPTISHPPQQVKPIGMGNDETIDATKEPDHDQNQLEIWNSTKDNRRTKERKISFVIEKVSMWRKLYNGIQDSQAKIVRYSLEDAAK